MAADKHSVVLHYDEAKDELVVFSIPSDKALDLRNGAGFELPLSVLRRLEHNEAERRVGGGILHLVESFSGTKLGLRDYEAQSLRELEQMIADAEKEPDAQTPQGQFGLAVLYRDLALRKKSADLMAKAKVLTQASAKGGHADALFDLENWNIYERQFDRRVRGE